MADRLPSRYKFAVVLSDEDDLLIMIGSRHREQEVLDEATEIAQGFMALKDEEKDERLRVRPGTRRP